MKYLLVILILIASFLSYSRTLVFPRMLTKGANGCKTDEGVELKVGQFVQDLKVCGVLKCIAKTGAALHFYCQRVLPFAQCNSYAVSKQVDFPKCCWTCVEEVPCGADGKPIEAPANETKSL